MMISTKRLAEAICHRDKPISFAVHSTIFEWPSAVAISFLCRGTIVAILAQGVMTGRIIIS